MRNPQINRPDVQSMLVPTGDQARTLDALLSLMHWVCGAMYALVIAALLAAVVRAWYARRDGRMHARVSERMLGIGLNGWIALSALGLVVLTTASFLADRTLLANENAPPDIRVTGRQWWWRIDYLDTRQNIAFTTANELHLPRGHTTRIELRSDDVIHSFWVPGLAGKRDLIPGRTNHIALTPRANTVLRGQCAEFCGLQHANMAFAVVVEDDTDYAAWRARQTQPAKSNDAKIFADAGCAMCHTIRGTQAQGTFGPDLTHLASRLTLAAGTLPMDAQALRDWIADPQPHKRGVTMPATTLADDQRDALVAYLLALQ